MRPPLKNNYKNMEVERAERIVSDDIIIDKIYTSRGKKVMIDNDLAELYDVPTKRLNEQVRRNIKRFPAGTEE
jgi:hypothetical protein